MKVMFWILILLSELKLNMDKWKMYITYNVFLVSNFGEKKVKMDSQEMYFVIFTNRPTNNAHTKMNISHIQQI